MQLEILLRWSANRGRRFFFLHIFLPYSHSTKPIQIATNCKRSRLNVQIETLICRQCIYESSPIKLSFSYTWNRKSTIWSCELFLCKMLFHFSRYEERQENDTKTPLCGYYTANSLIPRFIRWETFEII